MVFDNSKPIMDQVHEMDQRMQADSALVRRIAASLLEFAMAAVTLYAFVGWVFMRTKFGERAISVPIVVLALLAMLPFPFALSDNGYPTTGSNTAIGIMVAFFIVVVLQTVVTHWNRRQVRIWHSRCTGIPLIPWQRLPVRVSELQVGLILEPIIVLVAIVILRLGENSAAWMLFFILCSMVAKTLYHHGKTRAMVWDQIDQQIQAEWTQKFIEGEPPTEATYGYAIPGHDRLSEDDRTTLFDAYTNIDPRLKKLMEQPAEERARKSETGVAGSHAATAVEVKQRPASVTPPLSSGEPSARSSRLVPSTGSAELTNDS